MSWFTQLVQDVANPIGAIARQTGVAPGLATLMSPGGAIAGAVAGNVTGLTKEKEDAAAAALLPAGQLTPAQSAQARNTDFATGQARWQSILAANPEYASNLARLKEQSQGLNSTEMTAAKEGLATSINGANQGAMRKLYQNQARAGVRGGMAGAQAMRMQRQGMQDRQAGEQKLLLDNYALKQQGLKDYTSAVNSGIQGELATGTGEASLGVSDRTAATQAQINAAMMAAANKKEGLLGIGFMGL